jgi:hypothetical protein
MRRRDLVKGIVGSALSWPLSSRAQQPALPVIGFRGSASPDSYSRRLRVFREGLKEAGYVEGENVKIEYRWAGAMEALRHSRGSTPLNNDWSCRLDRNRTGNHDTQGEVIALARIPLGGRPNVPISSGELRCRPCISTPTLVLKTLRFRSRPLGG